MELNKKLSEQITVDGNIYENYKEYIFQETKTTIPLYVNLAFDNFIVWRKSDDNNFLFESLFTQKFEKYYSKEKFISLTEFKQISINLYESILKDVRNFFSHYSTENSNVILNEDKIELINNLKELVKQNAIEKNNDTSLIEDFELFYENELTIAGAIFITCNALTKKDAVVFLSQNVGFKDTRDEKKYRRLFFTSLCKRDNNKRIKLNFTNHDDWLFASIMAELNRIPLSVYYSLNDTQREKLDDKLEQISYNEYDEPIMEDDKIQLRKSDRFMQLSLLYLDLLVLDNDFQFPFHNDKILDEIDNISNKFEYSRNKLAVENKWYKLSDENRVVLKIKPDSIKNIKFIHLSRNNILELLLIHFAFNKKENINTILKKYIQTFKYQENQSIKANFENRRKEAIINIEHKLNQFNKRKPNYFTINSNILYYLQRFLAINNNVSKAIDFFNLEEYNKLRECLINFSKHEYRDKFWSFVKDKNFEQYLSIIELEKINNIDEFYTKLLMEIKKYFENINSKYLETIFYVQPAPNQNKKPDNYYNSIQNNFSIENGALLASINSSYNKNDLLFKYTNQKLSINSKNKQLLKNNLDWNVDGTQKPYFSKLTLPYHLKAYERLLKKLSKNYSDREKRKKYNTLKAEVLKYCIQDAFLLNILYDLKKEINDIKPQQSFYSFYRKQDYETSIKYGNYFIKMNLKDTQKYSSIFKENIVDAYYKNDNSNKFSKDLNGLNKIKQEYIRTQDLIIKNWLRIEKILFEKHKNRLLEIKKENSITTPQGDFLRLLELEFGDVSLKNEFYDLRKKALHNDINQNWFDNELISKFIKFLNQ